MLHDGILAVFDGFLALKQSGSAFVGLIYGERLSFGALLFPEVEVEAVLVLAVDNSFTHITMDSVQMKRQYQAMPTSTLSYNGEFTYEHE